MIPFCDCTSGGLQLKEMDSAVVASTVKLTGGMLGAAVNNGKTKRHNTTNVCKSKMYTLFSVMEYGIAMLHSTTAKKGN